jgi:AcrR family transcriptional regulator
MPDTPVEVSNIGRPATGWAAIGDEMVKGSIDRRVGRTRALLQQAHVSLILEKGYEATTVQDICEAANIGRSTFYAHFKDKDDLRRSSLQQLRNLLLERQRESRARRQGEKELTFSLTMLEHARDHIHLYRALVGTQGGSVALATIRQILSDVVRSEPMFAAKVAVQREFSVQYIVGAFIAILTWWLDGGAKLPPEQVDEMFRCLALKGLEGVQVEGRSEST